MSTFFCPHCLHVSLHQRARNPARYGCPRCGFLGTLCPVCSEEHERPGKCWQAALGPVLTRVANEEIAAEIARGDYGPCIDAYRVARLSSKRDLRRFRTRRSCCGSQEWVMEILGQRVLLGFNYGH